MFDSDDLCIPQESQDDFLNYEKPQVLNQPSNSVVFEHSNHSAIIVNDAEPILDRGKLSLTYNFDF